MRPFSIRRREQQASRRMGLRLAILLALVILAVFGYWRYQVRQALDAARADASVEACGDLEETEDLVAENDPQAQGVDQAALAARLQDCEAQGLGEDGE